MKLIFITLYKLGGGKTMIDHTNEQQRTLEQRRAEVAARRANEVEVARKLEEQEEKGEELEKTYSSLQQEVEVKTRKLRKMFAKLQSVKQVYITQFNYKSLYRF